MPDPVLRAWPVRLMLATGLLAVHGGCAPAPVTPTQTPPLPRSATPAPSPSVPPSPTAQRTPPALPQGFTTDLLNPLDTPHRYVADTCRYLRDRWNPAGSPPGTIVMVIMFHSVTEDPIANPNQISLAGFQALMDGLRLEGFEAITTARLAEFLEHNAAIPPRSVLLVADDRHYGAYFEKLFRPYWERFGWPVVNSWISAEGTTADLWAENVELERQGWVDHQAHGVVHNIPIWPGSSEEYILGELQGSIDAFQAYFGKTPVAIIWPGGGFTPRAAELARQTGYRLGFTINPRGPLMYNWIPLSDENDPQRPSYQPEGGVNDPLMVLPRFWDTDALSHLPRVLDLASQAAAHARETRGTELEYYDIVCAPEYGPFGE